MPLKAAESPAGGWQLAIGGWQPTHSPVAAVEAMAGAARYLGCHIPRFVLGVPLRSLRHGRRVPDVGDAFSLTLSSDRFYARLY